MYRFRGTNSDGNPACSVSVVMVCSGEVNARVFDGTGTSLVSLLVVPSQRVALVTGSV
jgi:hypothetical protein